MSNEAVRSGGVNLEALSDEEVRGLRKSATQELRRRGLLPAKKEREAGGGAGKEARKRRRAQASE